MNNPLFRLPALALLAVTFALTVPALTAQEKITNKGVKKRVALMLSAQGAVTTLTEMMAGRMVFDAGQARAARRILVQTSSSTSRRFRKPHQDPLSNARPEIWTYWEEFSTHADNAEQAAKQLNTYSLSGLQRTLPNVLHNCLSCHERFRETPNEFVTH